MEDPHSGWQGYFVKSHYRPSVAVPRHHRNQHRHRSHRNRRGNQKESCHLV